MFASQLISNLRGEVSDMCFFFLECGFGHEYRKVAVLHADFLDFGVEPVLDCLPDGVRPGPEYIAAGHVVILDQLAFGDNLRVPVGKVLFFLCFQTESGLLF